MTKRQFALSEQRRAIGTLLLLCGLCPGPIVRSTAPPLRSLPLNPFLPSLQQLPRPPPPPPPPITTTTAHHSSLLLRLLRLPHSLDRLDCWPVFFIRDPPTHSSLPRLPLTNPTSNDVALAESKGRKHHISRRSVRPRDAPTATTAPTATATATITCCCCYCCCCCSSFPTRLPTPSLSLEPRKNGPTPSRPNNPHALSRPHLLPP